MPSPVSCRRPAIAFFGHFGGGNFGNEATLLALLQHLMRSIADADFSCICTVPEKVKADYQISAVPK